MKHNASKLIIEGQECLADLSCEGFICNMRTYAETKIFDLKLGSYRLSSPYGLLAESATAADSFVGIFSYKPFDAQVDWSLAAKASPCYMTYLKESIDQIVTFFKSGSAISQNLALETAAILQMTIDGVKRTAQEQVTRALREKSSLRGKQVQQVSAELTGGLQNILVLFDSGQYNPKVLEDGSALILLCDNDEILKTWYNRLQGAIYRASVLDDTFAWMIHLLLICNNYLAVHCRAWNCV